jgi:aspartate beta-hydroxylase
MTEELHRSADQSLARGDFAGAIRSLEALVAAASDDFPAWIKLASLRRRTGDATAALDAVNAALDARSNDFLALLLKASLHEQLADPDRAAEIYRAALFHAESAGTLPPSVSAQLDHARRFLQSHRSAIEARLPALDLDALHARRSRQFVENVLERPTLYRQEPTHYRYPGLPDTAFFDEAHPELMARLRAAWPDIRRELEGLLAGHRGQQRPYVDFGPGQPVGQWADLNRSPKWNALHLIRYGDRDPVNAALCPTTIEAFAGPAQADVPGLSPNLMFSLLAPHTHIPPHHGVANFRAVLHLPLIVPPACRFRVGGETREWVEGEPWIFDDTIEHEAWNDSDELRVVLIGDVWRPELDAQDRAIIRGFFEANSELGEIGAL